MTYYLYPSISQYSYDIEEIFRGHRYELQDKKRLSENKIDDWVIKLCSEIKKHADEQKEYLRIYYNDVQRRLTEREKDFIGRARTYYCQSELSQITELLRQCRALKSEVLAVFDREDKPLPFIYCMTEEQYEQKKRPQSSAPTTTNNTSEKSSATNQYRDSNASSASSISSSNNHTFTDEQKSNGSFPESKSTYHRSASNNIDQNVQNITDEDLEKTCPVCYMIYPSNLNRFDRQNHVDEHFKDK